MMVRNSRLGAPKAYACLAHPELTPMGIFATFLTFPIILPDLLISAPGVFFRIAITSGTARFNAVAALALSSRTESSNI
uniref:Uncharacterized protein n=1 Tax=Magallana gigas TaxID=29159 RepID=K1R9Z1_MAGGI